jgi:hypothetical protein
MEGGPPPVRLASMASRPYPSADQQKNSVSRYSRFSGNSSRSTSDCGSIEPGAPKNPRYGGRAHSLSMSCARADAPHSRTTTTAATAVDAGEPIVAAGRLASSRLLLLALDTRTPQVPARSLGYLAARLTCACVQSVASGDGGCSVQVYIGGAGHGGDGWPMTRTGRGGAPRAWRAGGERGVFV